MTKIVEGILSTKEMVGWEEIMDHERNIIAVIIIITITILNVGEGENKDR